MTTLIEHDTNARWSIIKWTDFPSRFEAERRLVLMDETDGKDETPEEMEETIDALHDENEALRRRITEMEGELENARGLLDDGFDIITGFVKPKGRSAEQTTARGWLKDAAAETEVCGMCRLSHPMRAGRCERHGKRVRS